MSFRNPKLLAAARDQPCVPCARSAPQWLHMRTVWPSARVPGSNVPITLSPCCECVATPCTMGGKGDHRILLFQASRDGQMRQAGNLQHRPRLPIHRPLIYLLDQGQRYSDQHGRHRLLAG